jgi:hypothetical protein
VVAALRGRFGAAKPEAQTPQSVWHGFEKAAADMVFLFCASPVAACPSSFAEAW